MNRGISATKLPENRWNWRFHQSHRQKDINRVNWMENRLFLSIVSHIAQRRKQSEYTEDVCTHEDTFNMYNASTPVDSRYSQLTRLFDLNEHQSLYWTEPKSRLPTNKRITMNFSTFADRVTAYKLCIIFARDAGREYLLKQRGKRYDTSPSSLQNFIVIFLLDTDSWKSSTDRDRGEYHRSV